VDLFHRLGIGKFFSNTGTGGFTRQLLPDTVTHISYLDTASSCVDSNT